MDALYHTDAFRDLLSTTPPPRKMFMSMCSYEQLLFEEAGDETARQRINDFVHEHVVLIPLHQSIAQKTAELLAVRGGRELRDYREAVIEATALVYDVPLLHAVSLD